MPALRSRESANSNALPDACPIKRTYVRILNPRMNLELKGGSCLARGRRLSSATRWADTSKKGARDERILQKHTNPYAVRRYGSYEQYSERAAMRRVESEASARFLVFACAVARPGEEALTCAVARPGEASIACSASRSDGRSIADAVNRISSAARDTSVRRCPERCLS